MLETARPINPLAGGYPFGAQHISMFTAIQQHYFIVKEI